MNRQDFYLSLALELNNLKVPPELINTHIDQFKQYLQTLSEADAEKQIASFGDVKALAANIYRLLCGGDDDFAPTEKAPEKTEEESVYDAFRVETEDEDIVDLLADDSVTSDTPDISAIDDTPADAPLDDIGFSLHEAEFEPEPQLEPQFEQQNEPLYEAQYDVTAEAAPIVPEEEYIGGRQEPDFVTYDDDGYIPPDPAAFGEAEPTTPPLSLDMSVPQMPLRQEPAEEGSFTEFTFEDLPKRKERSVGGLILFYTLFILTLPLTLSLFLVSMAAFGILYLLLGVLTGLFFTLIFGTAVAGALFALSGGLYGIGQLNAGSRAIGLFELGLALIIVGITIFVCFLFSMISLKWLPALLKYLTVFLRFYLSKLLALFKYLKGRCEQL